MANLGKITRGIAYVGCPIALALNLSSPDYLGFSLPKLPSMGQNTSTKSEPLKQNCSPAPDGSLQKELENRGIVPKCNGT